MTDILIPLGSGSRHDNIELRYSLRSVEKHLHGVGNIWIVGECPDWVKGVVKIPCPDNTNNWMRAHNIYRKILKGCNTIHDMKFWQTDDDFEKNNVTVSAVVLSDIFLFMNDDHFLLADYITGEFPYYYRGAIELHRIGNEAQRHQMGNTAGVLGNQAFLDYDVHCPIIYNRKAFQNIFSRLPENWPEYGYGIKSIYANLAWSTHTISLIDKVQIEDLKFSEPLMKESIYRVLESRRWFSIGDRCLKSGAMKEVLQELYPLKSKYEI